jgi:GTPase SAR1 family protein
MQAISNRKILDAKFKTTDFEGKWLSSFGRPSLCGSWLIFGRSGSGKTTFTLQLCKYLTRFGRVAYNSLEQGFSPSLQMAWCRVGMEEAGNGISLLNKENLAGMREHLKRRHGPDVMVVDSVKYLLGFKLSDYVALKKDFPNRLFIFIAHEDNNEPSGAIAKMIRYDADVKIRTEGYKAFITTRYENAEKGEGGADFIIWEQGAQEYWTENL